MAVVHERIYIEAPYTQALGAFERRLGLTPGAPSGTCALTLVVPTSDKHEIARVVTATTERVPGTANYQSNYKIRWDGGKTAGGFPTPSFSGTLQLGAGETYSECALVLEGSYEPPGGVAGGIFNELIGKRIAHSTMSTLLDEVGRELHRDHEKIEAEKRTERSAT
jgi:hypothetical protein